MTPQNPLQAKLSELFEKYGFINANPPVLYPSNLFLDLAGEDIGKRLFRTTAENGSDKCLRPDFTIPIAQYYIESGLSGQSASFYYSGLIFRKRAQQSGEIEQIGIERIGSDKPVAVDAETLNLAYLSIITAGIENPIVKIGDEAIFSDVLKAIDLPSVWTKRLKNLFGDRKRLNQAILRMSGKDSPDLKDDEVLAYFSKNVPEINASAVEDYMTSKKIIPVGERKVQEIADRLLEKITLSTKIEKEKTDLLTNFLNINSPVEQSTDAIRNFEKSAQIDLSESISRYQERLDQIKTSKYSPNSMKFSADFGRRLNYYTGFIFEIFNSDSNSTLPLCGGGRYDHLLRLLGAPDEIPAIGFSIWLERILGEQQ